MVIIRCGANCAVEGYDGTRVMAETDSRWNGISMRIVVRVGNHTLFHSEWSSKGSKITGSDDAVEVNVGGSCRVKVPASSSLKIYAGKHASVASVHGPVLINAGGDARAIGVGSMEPCNAGGTIEVDCERLTADDAKFNAGNDIRIRVRSLSDARVMVNDAGGFWDGEIGNGRTTVRLRCGGAATLITEHEVRGKILGNIERPA